MIPPIKIEIKKLIPYDSDSEIYYYFIISFPFRHILFMKNTSDSISFLDEKALMLYIQREIDYYNISTKYRIENCNELDFKLCGYFSDSIYELLLNK